MSDASIISLLPPQPGSTILPSTILPAGTSGSLAQILANLAPGGLLSGFIVNRDAAGNPILRTDTGDFAFSSNLNFNIGSAVDIRVSGAAGQARILAVDGQPPEVAAALSAFASDPEIIVSQSLLAASTSTDIASLTEPVINLRGTLITPAGDGEVLPSGTQVGLRVVSIAQAGQAGSPATIATVTDADAAATTAGTSTTPPSQGVANSSFYSSYASRAGIGGTPAAPGMASVTTQSASISAPQEFRLAQPPASPAELTRSPSAVAAAGAEITPAGITAIAAQPTAADLSAISGRTLTATVIGTELTGESVLQTPIGIIRLLPGTALPLGAQVTVQVGPLALPAQALPGTLPTVLPGAAPSQLALEWTALQQIFALLAANAQQGGRTFVPPNMPFIQPVVPPVGSRAVDSAQTMPYGIMQFIASLRGGDFSDWMGQDNAQWLRNNGHEALLQKAHGEFEALARQFTDPPLAAHNWQPLYFPVAVGAELHQARLFVKRDRQEGGGGQEGGREDTRFVLEVDLSQLGEVQMDGFVRKQPQGVQFDLMIRTLKPMAEDMQRDIQEIYQDAGELTGFSGSVVFQSVHEFPVNPMQDIITRGIGTVVA